MSKRILNRWFLTALVAVCATFSAFGQAAGTYTPYSIYGVGDLSQPGSAYNKTMGGVGVALRNNRYLNLLNPAAVTARDSLAFMADFSLYNDNKVFQQGGIKSASNTFNINNLAMSFPIWRSSAMMVGIMPYSDTGFGYSFEYTDPDLIGHTGNINYSATGKGSIYKAFAAAGVDELHLARTLRVAGVDNRRRGAVAHGNGDELRADDAAPARDEAQFDGLAVAGRDCHGPRFGGGGKRGDG